jgi:hypothetical protein
MSKKTILMAFTVIIAGILACWAQITIIDDGQRLTAIKVFLYRINHTHKILYCHHDRNKGYAFGELDIKSKEEFDKLVNRVDGFKVFSEADYSKYRVHKSIPLCDPNSAIRADYKPCISTEDINSFGVYRIDTKQYGFIIFSEKEHKTYFFSAPRRGD